MNFSIIVLRTAFFESEEERIQVFHYKWSNGAESCFNIGSGELSFSSVSRIHGRGVENKEEVTYFFSIFQ
jgi:hypothetical protein